MTNAQFRQLTAMVDQLVARMRAAKAAGRADLVKATRRELWGLIKQISVWSIAAGFAEGLATKGSSRGVGCNDCTTAALAGLASKLRGAM